MGRPVMVKVTSKNQITLPDALMRELGRPSHFQAYVNDGNLVLFSAKLATYDDQAKAAGIPPAVLRRAYAVQEERRAAKAGAAAATTEAVPAKTGGS